MARLFGGYVMADDADLANDYNDLLISRALTQLIRPDASMKQGPKLCGECEEPIPSERRKLGFKFCVRCAEETERRKALFANY
jgi:RNA polymerase-binding transcription factor DksA